MNRRLTTDSEGVFIGLAPPTLNSATSMVRTTMLYVKTRPRFGSHECNDAAAESAHSSRLLKCANVAAPDITRRQRREHK